MSVSSIRCKLVIFSQSCMHCYLYLYLFKHCKKRKSLAHK
nr:MAG TPA: hypothetical protein [Caudoviricetes sp.]